MGQSCHRQKKSNVYACRVALVVSDSLCHPCGLWPARLLCQGVLQARILEHSGQDWLLYLSAAAAAANLLQSCLTLCNPIDSSPSGSPVPGILQAEHWSGLSFPSPVHVCMLSDFSVVWLCATPWTAAHQTPLFTGFSRQEYWSRLPCPSPPYMLTLGFKFSLTLTQFHYL